MSAYWGCRRKADALGVDGVPRLRSSTYLTMALALSLLAAALTYRYLNRLGAHVPVVVAAADLTLPQRLSAESVEVVELPARAVHPLAFSDPTAVIGRVNRRPLSAGEQVLEPDLAGAGDDGIWSALLGEGEGALYVPLGPERALGGAVRAGDRVDVIVVGEDGLLGEAMSAVLVTGARVLDVRDPDGLSASAGEARYPAGALLAVPSGELTRLALAVERGRIYLALSARGTAAPPPVTGADLVPVAVETGGEAP